MIRAAAVICGTVSCAAVAAVILLSAALAQAPTATVTVVPDGGLTIGDPVEIRVRIQHAADEQVQFDGVVVQLGELEPSAPVITAVSETETLITFPTRAFATGVFAAALPSIAVQRADGSGSELTLPSVSIAVLSVLGESAEARPLTAPDALEDERRTFAPWIVAFIGIGLGFVLARVVRRRVRRGQRAAPARAATQAEAAAPVQFELDPTLGAAEQCRQLASAVRARLAADWTLPAAALTASEIGPALAAAGAPGVIALRATRLLEACDRVQYGGEQPTPERLRGYLQLAEAIWADGEAS